ncbi:hypothetical protein J3F83DRAFT_716335 [Trichoderma novae-zelandiae]
MDPFATDEHTATASAAFQEFLFSNEPTAETRRFQTAAYNTLIDDGGRPSHPLSLLESIASAPGKYRDILAFWQDRSDEWQVFHKQLSRWQTFRTHQRASRNPERFNSHIEDLLERLERHSFVLPPGLGKPPNGLSLDLAKQNKLATWIEYVNYEFTRRDEYEKWLDTCRPGYDAALAQLMDAQVLEPFERVRTSTSDICRPSSLEVTRRKGERRKAEEACEIAKKRMVCMDALGGSQTPQQMEEHERQYEEAMLRLKAINKRAYTISDFGRKTHAYRFALDRSERHELLLRWAMDQIPLIEEELRQEERPDSAAQTQAHSSSPNRPDEPALSQFQRLPPEIRQRIWGELVPRRPSVHFFEVLNRERRRHLAASWSSAEFRVRATKKRDSSYLSVYALLATCRESRSVVETYYICRRRGVSCPLSGGTINFSDRPPDFRTFDWIPSNDLVVLCFPPVQVAQLPPRNALTLSPGPNQAARRIGVLVPAEVMSMTHFNPMDEGEDDDDAAQIAMIPDFINKLHRPSHPGHQTTAIPRGIWKLYLIIEGWSTNHITMQLTAGIDTNKPADNWADNSIYWLFQSAKRGERMLPWRCISQPSPRHTHSPVLSIMHNQNIFFNSNFNHGSNQRIINRPAKEFNGARQLYWLGSSRPVLGTLRPEDLVQKPSANKLHDFMQTLSAQCRAQQWHAGFGGVEALGWLEPAGDKGVIEAELWQLEEIARDDFQ